MNLIDFLEKYFGLDTVCGCAESRLTPPEVRYLNTHGHEAVDQAFEEILRRLREGIVIFPVGEANLPWSTEGAGESTSVLEKMVWNMPPLLGELVPTSRGIELKFRPKER